MSRSFGQLIRKLGDFIERDLIYILNGYFMIWVGISVFGSNILIEHPIPNFAYLITIPLAYSLSTIAREIVVAPGFLCTTKVLKGNFSSAFQACWAIRLSNWHFVLDSASGPSGDFPEIIDRAFGTKKKDDHRTFQVYKRAIFLKEMYATTGSTLLMSGIFILFGDALPHILDQSIVWSEWFVSVNFVFSAALFVIGVLTCRTSVYHAFRQGNELSRIQSLASKRLAPAQAETKQE